jgi:hypothetical protein
MAQASNKQPEFQIKHQASNSERASKTNLASNQTASIEAYNVMQTSHKAGVKRITSISNQTSYKEIK